MIFNDGHTIDTVTYRMIRAYLKPIGTIAPKWAPCLRDSSAGVIYCPSTHIDSLQVLQRTALGPASTHKDTLKVLQRTASGPVPSKAGHEYNIAGCSKSDSTARASSN